MKLIKAGTYKAQPFDAALATTKKGTEFVAVGLRLLDGPDKGETIVWYGYLTEDARPMTYRSLGYCGWSGVAIDDLESVRNVVEIVIEIENDQDGEPSARVRWINPVGGGLRLKNRLTPEQARKLAAKLRKLDAAAHRGSAETPQKTAVPGDGASDDANEDYDGEGLEEVGLDEPDSELGDAHDADGPDF